MLSDTALGYGGVAAACISLVQSMGIHRAALLASRNRYQQSILQSSSQHRQNTTEGKRSFLLKLFHDLEQHFQELNADLITASKESERDMFDQRNQSFQAVIISSSVMFTALATAIFNANVPTTSSTWLLVLLSLTSAMAFLLLVVCIVLCVELVIRTSNFMYRRAKFHRQNLHKGMGQSQQMMRLLRSDGDSEKKSPTDADREVQSHSLKRTFADLDGIQLLERWGRHEQHLSNLLLVREEINEYAFPAQLNTINFSAPANLTFPDFWQESCRIWAATAFLSFYLGTQFLLCAILLFMWARFTSDSYHSMAAGVISVVLLGGMLLVSSAFMVSINRPNSTSRVILPSHLASSLAWHV